MGEQIGPDDDAGALRKAAGVAKSAASGAAGFVAGRRFERTPAGKARAAGRRGASTFHIRLDLDDITYRSGKSSSDPSIDDAIGRIENEGWNLDNLEYVTESDEWEKTDGEGEVVRGSVQRTFAVLLFRRAESDDGSEGEMR